MPDTPPESGVGKVPATEQEARAELREKYAATIRRLWKRQPDECPICGSNLWNIGDLVQAPIREVAGAREALIAQLGGKPLLPMVYVYVPVTCLVCGYTMFFHSGTLDVRDEETVKVEPPVFRSESDPRRLP
jgi:RNase P subunit RPR2